MTDEEIVAALAEALRASSVWLSNGWDGMARDFLLPVVRRVAEQRAAEAVQPLLDLANEIEAHPGAAWYDADRIRAAVAAAGKGT